MNDSYVINLDLDPRAGYDTLHNGPSHAQRSSMIDDAAQQYFLYNLHHCANGESNDHRVEDQSCNASNENNEEHNNRSEDNATNANGNGAHRNEDAPTDNNVAANDDASGNGGEAAAEENPNSELSEDFPVSPEIRALLVVLKRYVPYVLILLVKIVYDHCLGILNLFLLFVTFICANNDLKREIAKQHNRSWLTLWRILFQIFGCFFLISYVFGDELPIFYPQPTTMWELLWFVAVMDFSIKLATIAIKVLLTCLPLRLLAVPKRVRDFFLDIWEIEFWKESI